MDTRSQQILDLIFERKFDQAEKMIDAAREKISANQEHRLTALSAVLQRELGNIDRAIELMQLAREKAPTWLPHLYRLSDFLMEAQKWAEALTVLDELVLLSEQANDPYFVSDAKAKRIECLKALE